MTGLDVVKLLRASHIKRWSECESDEERLDVFNGLLLVPHLDALFDEGWATFRDCGTLHVSSSLNGKQRATLGIASGLLRVEALTDRHRHYLEWHRKRVFRDG